MDKGNVRKLLEQLRSGSVSVDAALEKMRSLPYEDLGFAKIDTHRGLRQGFPEVIFCQGKTPAQVRDIVKRMMEHHPLILGMRADEAAYKAVCEVADARYNKAAHAVIVGEKPEIRHQGLILVITAGTADMPVSEEAALTAELMGNRVERMMDG